MRTLARIYKKWKIKRRSEWEKFWSPLLAEMKGIFM